MHDHQVQQVFCHVDVLDSELLNDCDIRTPSPFTDAVHPRNMLPLELTEKDDISEATKRAKLILVKRLIDKYSMDRVLVSTFLLLFMCRYFAVQIWIVIIWSLFSLKKAMVRKWSNFQKLV